MRLVDARAIIPTMRGNNWELSLRFGNLNIGPLWIAWSFPPWPMAWNQFALGWAGHERHWSRCKKNWRKAYDKSRWSWHRG